MRIPFLDLSKINKPHELLFKKEFETFLDNGYYILGSSVRKFEDEFAKYCGSKYCIGVGNGLDALTLILKGYIEIGKLEKGNEVLVAANTYIATIIAIENAGLVPVLIDADINTFNLDTKLLPDSLTSNIKAILITHLYGQLANMTVLKDYCKKHNLLLISDSAQAHGASDKEGKKAGNLSDASGFSFYPTKNLGALGDGGAITTNDNELNEVLIKLRNYGKSSAYVNEYIGVNSRLDEIQASFLRIKLKSLDSENKRRQEIAAQYLNGISNAKIICPKISCFESHVFHQFVIRVKDRKKFIEYLNNKEIGSLIHYPIPPYKQEPYKNKFEQRFSVTDQISDSVISIPNNPSLRNHEIDYIIESLNTYN